MDLADDLGRRRKGLVALFPPLRGAGLGRGRGKMDICMDLAQGFFDVPSEIVEIELGIEQGPFRADDKGAPERKTRGLVIDPEHPGEPARGIGTHGVFDLFKHFFVALPCEVGELRVGADGEYLGAGLFESFVLLCQSSKFSGSDEGKIGGIEEEDRPFLCGLLSCQGYFAEIALHGIEGLQLEIRYCLSDSYGATLF